VKYQAKIGETIVTGVKITVGHNGDLCPTLQVEPVYVGGVTISNVQVSNWNKNSENPSAAHIAIGDKVLVERAGDVIPRIKQVTDPVYRCPKCGLTGNANEQLAHHQPT
jgi:DNA ligase (NAD+)